MAKNDGIGNEVQDPFPGCSAGWSHAIGSDGSRTPPPDAKIPNEPTGVTDTGTIGELPHGDGQSASTNQPGQNDGFPPPIEGSYTDSGAGEGHSIADQHRYPWQEKPGG